MASVSGCEYPASATNGPTETVSHKARRRKSSTGAVAHDGALQGQAAVTRLDDRRARADQPAACAVERATQQQMSGRQSPRRPVRAAIFGCQNHTAFSEDPAALRSGKDRVRQARVYIQALEI